MLEGMRGLYGKRTILVKPSCFAPEFEMIIQIPECRDTEEYIDELLEGILADEFDRVNRLLSIDSLADMADGELILQGANTNHNEGIFME